MKAKLLLSAAVIGLVAMSPAIAETVIVPVVPGSLDGANSSTGDGGDGGDADATANSPSDSTNSAFATGGAGGSGGDERRQWRPREGLRDDDDHRRVGKQLERVERNGRRRGRWHLGISAATAAPRTHPPTRRHPAPPGLSRPRRPRREATAAARKYRRKRRRRDGGGNGDRRQRPSQRVGQRDWRRRRVERRRWRLGPAIEWRPGPAVFGQSSGGPVVVHGSATAGNADPALASAASVTLSNAVGGATTGSLSLTQSATGGDGGGNAPGGDATSLLSGNNPSGASAYSLTANATGGDGGPGQVIVHGRRARRLRNRDSDRGAVPSDHGSVSAVTSATGRRCGQRR